MSLVGLGSVSGETGGLQAACGCLRKACVQNAISTCSLFQAEGRDGRRGAFGLASLGSLVSVFLGALAIWCTRSCCTPLCSPLCRCQPHTLHMLPLLCRRLPSAPPALPCGHLPRQAAGRGAQGVCCFVYGWEGANQALWPRPLWQRGLQPCWVGELCVGSRWGAGGACCSFNYGSVVAALTLGFMVVSGGWLNAGAFCVASHWSSPFMPHPHPHLRPPPSHPSSPHPTPHTARPSARSCCRWTTRKQAGRRWRYAQWAGRGE